MVFKCSKGTFQLVKNYRDAFKQEAFEEKYLEECFDRDAYIVGDIASEILRLKGFDNDPKSKDYYGFIDDYLDISCAFGCPHYILKRIKSEDEARKLENVAVITEDDRVQMKSITKENFDKESLVLKPSQKVRPHIVIDPKRMNAIPKGELPSDLKDDTRDVPRRTPAEPEKPVVVETFVSASEDFDPSKKQDRFRKNKPQKDKKESQNQNGNKQNNSQNGNKQNNGNPQGGSKSQNNQNGNNKNNNQNGNNRNNNQNGKPQNNQQNRPAKGNNNQQNHKPNPQNNEVKPDGAAAGANEQIGANSQGNNGGNRNSHNHRRNRGHGNGGNNGGNNNQSKPQSQGGNE